MKEIYNRILSYYSIFSHKEKVINKRNTFKISNSATQKAHHIHSFLPTKAD